MMFQFALQELKGQSIDSVNISDISSKVKDDSLKIGFTVNVSNFQPGRRESLTLVPRITDGNISVALPAVVYSGTFRRKYDRRRHVYSTETQPAVYNTYTDINRDSAYAMQYEWSIPYSSRYQTCNLTVEFRYDDCCNVYQLKEESFPLPDMQYAEREYNKYIYYDTVYKIFEVDESVAISDNGNGGSKLISVEKGNGAGRGVQSSSGTGTTVRLNKEMLYLEYPVNEAHIYPDFGNNQAELSKIDDLFRDYGNKRVRVTAYASPEGFNVDNEKLSKNRADSFMRYLLNHYGITEGRVTSAYVGEDWEGLRQKIAESDIEMKKGAIAIIDSTISPAERKRQLMQLNNGEFWRQLEPYFKILRRIEVEIINN
jgi:hypothetical protein